MQWWRQPSDDVFNSVIIQANRHNDRLHEEFAINLGVYFVSVGRVAGPPLRDDGTLPRNTAHRGRRLEKPGSRGASSSWWVAGREGTSTSDSVAHAILSDAVPWFDELTTLQAAADFLERNGGTYIEAGLKAGVFCFVPETQSERIGWSTATSHGLRRTNNRGCFITVCPRPLRRQPCPRESPLPDVARRDLHPRARTRPGRRRCHQRTGPLASRPLSQKQEPHPARTQPVAALPSQQQRRPRIRRSLACRSGGLIAQRAACRRPRQQTPVLAPGASGR